MNGRRPELRPAPVRRRGATGSGGARPSRRWRDSRLSLLVVAVLAGSALFLGGFSLGAHVATTPGNTGQIRRPASAPFWDVYSLIQKRFRRLAQADAGPARCRPRSRA